MKADFIILNVEGDLLKVGQALLFKNENTNIV